MSCILHIETSTEVCSVALSQDSSCIFTQESAGRYEHGESLGTYIDQALSYADSHAIPLDAVAVSCGPGSYTGLRIGVSMAKGLCYGLGGSSLPSLRLSSWEFLCCWAMNCPGCAALSMIDARRMEVYSAVYDRALREVCPPAAVVVDAGSFAPQLEEHEVWFFGNGAMKCSGVIAHRNALFIEGVRPLARWMFPLAEQALARGEFADVAYFEPYYLKEFVASVPRRLL